MRYELTWYTVFFGSQIWVCGWAIKFSPGQVQACHTAHNDVDPSPAGHQRKLARYCVDPSRAGHKRLLQLIGPCVDAMSYEMETPAGGCFVASSPQGLVVSIAYSILN